MMRQMLLLGFLEDKAGIKVDPQYRIHFTSDHMGAMLWWAGARKGETFYPDPEELVDYIIDQLGG